MPQRTNRSPIPELLTLIVTFTGIGVVLWLYSKLTEQARTRAHADTTTTIQTAAEAIQSVTTNVARTVQAALAPYQPDNQPLFDASAVEAVLAGHTDELDAEQQAVLGAWFNTPTHDQFGDPVDPSDDLVPEPDTDGDRTALIAPGTSLLDIVARQADGPLPAEFQQHQGG